MLPKYVNSQCLFRTAGTALEVCVYAAHCSLVLGAQVGTQEETLAPDGIRVQDCAPDGAG